MRFNKKGSELSMNVIIIAAIALLVLVILAVMLLQKGNDIQEGTGCEGLSGECISDGSSCADGMIHHPGASSSCGENKKCCIPLGNNN
ncbi:MAG: hypothetical protein ACQESC_01840 [Nanobdellota archaeon]